MESNLYVVHVVVTLCKTGPVAQRIRHLTTNQGIAGSSPARINTFSNSSRMDFSLLDMECQSLTIKGDMTAEIAGS